MMGDKFIYVSRRMSDTNFKLSISIYVFLIMALSFTDTFSTLYILSHGGTEVNPFMDVLLEMGTSYFVACKNIITFLGLWVLTKYKEYAILNIIIIIYILLVIYQLYLILLIKGML